MKLLSSTTLLLTSLFTTTLARLSIEFEPLPYNVAAGASYDVKWTANQDFVSLPKNKKKQNYNNDNDNDNSKRNPSRQRKNPLITHR